MKDSNSLKKFLEEHRVKDGEYTHTSISGGKYFIKEEEYNSFINIYTNTIFNEKITPHIIEKHKDVGPIVIDIDFRFDISNNNERVYTLQNIKDIIKIYDDVIKNTLHNVDNPISMVFEKSKPYIDRNLLKDGIHIMYPSIITSPNYQYYLRECVIEKIGDIIKEINPKNEIKDIIDKAVIYNNGWIMYGSSKPNKEPYKLTHIFKDTVELDIKDIPDFKEEILPKILSIRYDNGNKEYEYKENIIPIIEKYNINGKKLSNTQLKKLKSTTETINKDDLDTISRLVNILSIERADDYFNWIEVGMCLHNISKNLLEDWIEFSKRSEKFESEEFCKSKWNTFKNSKDGLTFGSLYHWARNDNPEEFNKIINDSIRIFIMKNVVGEGTHWDIAKVVYHMFKDKFVCSSIAKDEWWVYENHLWKYNEKGTSLRKSLSMEVLDEFCKIMIFYQRKIIETEDVEEKTKFESRAKTIFNIQQKLKNTSFKNCVMKECAEQFYVEKFQDKLDSNFKFLGFNNGVYDLKNNVFRDGRPSDYISFTTNIDYIEYDYDNENIIGVNKFIEKIFPKDSIRKYFLKFLSSCLEGVNNSETLHILFGCGSNGKSKIIELFENTIGDYACKLPISMLTQKRVGPASADPYLARTKGKRFAALQEPNKEDEINVGLMKELTGGDRVITRGLFKDAIEFKPQFKPILTCNHLPKVPADDGGVWRRLIAIEFQSKFVDKPDPDSKNEFERDNQLTENFDNWKEPFMYLLINKYYDMFKTQGLKVPKSVKKFTEKYRSDSDIFMDFYKEHIIEKENSYIVFGQLYTYFKEWLKEADPDQKCIKKSDFKKYIENNFPTFNNQKLKGYSLIGELTEDNLLDHNNLEQDNISDIDNQSIASSSSYVSSNVDGFKIRDIDPSKSHIYLSDKTPNNGKPLERYNNVYKDGITVQAVLNTKKCNQNQIKYDIKKGYITIEAVTII